MFRSFDAALFGNPLANPHQSGVRARVLLRGTGPGPSLRPKECAGCGEHPTLRHRDLRHRRPVQRPATTLPRPYCRLRL